MLVDWCSSLGRLTELGALRSRTIRDGFWDLGRGAGVGFWEGASSSMVMTSTDFASGVANRFREWRCGKG